MSSHLMHIQRILNCIATLCKDFMAAVLNNQEVLKAGLGQGYGHTMLLALAV